MIKGDKVTVKKSWHSDVSTGQPGIVDCQAPDGSIGVAITKKWHFADKELPTATRIIAFAKKDIEPI